MGAEFEVNSLEDMCSLMCDNYIPEKQKKGFWQVFDKDNITLREWWDINTCSECGNGGKNFKKFRYCPYCGVRMEESDTE